MITKQHSGPLGLGLAAALTVSTFLIGASAPVAGAPAHQSSPGDEFDPPVRVGSGAQVALATALDGTTAITTVPETYLRQPGQNDWMRTAVNAEDGDPIKLSGGGDVATFVLDWRTEAGHAVGERTGLAFRARDPKNRERFGVGPFSTSTRGQVGPDGQVTSLFTHSEHTDARTPTEIVSARIDLSLTGRTKRRTYTVHAKPSKTSVDFPASETLTRADGVTYVAWARRSGDGRDVRIMMARRGPDSGWSKPAQVFRRSVGKDDVKVNVTSLELAPRPNGVQVAWLQRQGDRTQTFPITQIMTKTVMGKKLRPATVRKLTGHLDASDFLSPGLTLRTDATGLTVLIWVRDEMSSSDSGGMVARFLKRGTTNWSGAEELDGLGRTIEVSENDRAFVGVAFDRRGKLRFSIPRPGGWTPPQTLATEESLAAQKGYAVTVDHSGRTTVGWVTPGEDVLTRTTPAPAMTRYYPARITYQPLKVGKRAYCQGGYTGADTVRVQWRRDNKVISTRRYFRPRQQDQGKNVRCKVIGTDGVETESTESPKTRVK